MRNALISIAVAFIGLGNAQAAHDVWYTYDSAERIQQFYAPSGAFQTHLYDESSNRVLLENSETNAVPVADQDLALDGASSLDVSLGGSDGDSYQIVGNPRHGTLSAISGHQVTYAPAAGYSGEDQFSYVLIRGGVTSGWVTVSLDITGTTASPGLPIVEITDPADGMMYEFSETSVVFSGSASDPDGTVGSVEYSVSNGTWQKAVGTSAWNFTVFGLVTGQNNISVRARDMAGNYGVPATISLTRRQNQPPVIQVNSPLPNKVVDASQTSIRVYGTASDTDGSIGAVQYRLNEGAWVDLSGSRSTWSFELMGLQEWDNTLEMRAQDSNFAWSEPVTNRIHRTPVDPSGSLLAQWHFDENLTDSSGSGLDLLSLDSVEFDPQGWSGQALNCSGIWGVCTESNSVLASLPLSVSVWVKPSAISQDQKLAGVSNLWTLILSDAGKPGVTISNSEYCAEEAILSEEWVHLAATWTTNQAGTLYVNGEWALEMPAWNPPVDSVVFCAGSSFDGAVDEINVWSACLTEGQILAEYTRARGTVTASVQGSGTVTGAGTYYTGSEVVLVAKADEGWEFSEWNDFDWNSSKEIRITEAEQSYVAEFTQGDGLISISVSLPQAVWSLTQYPQGYAGPLTGTGSVYSISAPAGSYTVSFSEYAGYDTPSSLSSALDVGGNMIFPGVYTKQIGGAGDQDGDGIPDSWESQYFTGATGADPYVDSDGDGYDNLNEYIAGTNPTNRQSCFKVQLTDQTEQGFTVSWTAVEGRVYDVLWTPSLGQKFAVLRAGLPYPQSSYVDNRNDAGSTGFYKIVVRLAASGDADGDGLPDSWELAYFSDSVSAAADADADQDGSSNLQEYIFGTNPKDKTDAQVLFASLQNTQMNLNVRSCEKRWYTIEGTDDLVHPNWIVLGRFFGTGEDMMLIDPDISALPCQYYRIKAEVMDSDPATNDSDGDGIVDIDDPEPFGKDSDHDGIPDAWENDHSLNSSGSNDGMDSDNDGYSDYAEYVFGTRPDSAVSRFFWSAAQTHQNGPWSFEVATASNRIYWVDHRSSMMAPWSVIKRFGGSGETNSFILTPPNGETGYFRIRATGGNVLELKEE